MSRPKTREDARDGWRRAGKGRESVLEANAHAGNLIDGVGFGFRVPVCANVISSQGVDGDEE